jgi:hypothetical protein
MYICSMNRPQGTLQSDFVESVWPWEITPNWVLTFIYRPGVDVIITIFCDFRQFPAEKLAFFSKTNAMIKIFHNLALLWVKNTNLSHWIFQRKYLKNHNLGSRIAWFLLAQHIKTEENIPNYHKTTKRPWNILSASTTLPNRMTGISIYDLWIDNYNAHVAVG